MNKKQELLKLELEKYRKKLEELKKEWSETKAGSRYGSEYLEMQIKVYEKMIEEVEGELGN